MSLRDDFNAWGRFTGGDFSSRQWLLAKWDVCEGVVWPQEKIDALVNLILERLAVEPQDSLVDLGCGGGWILQYLAPKVAFSVGLDFSSAMLENAAAVNKSSVLIQGEIGHLPLRSQSVVCGLCCFVLINMMDDAQVEAALLDMYRVLKPGGRLLVGQLPDKSASAAYDAAKMSYIEFCAQTYSKGRDFRDVHRMPQKLFDIPHLMSFLQRHNISSQLLPAFNPFYRPGEALTVEWRYDLLIKK